MQFVKQPLLELFMLGVVLVATVGCGSEANQPAALPDSPATSLENTNQSSTGITLDSAN